MKKVKKTFFKSKMQKKAFKKQNTLLKKEKDFFKENIAPRSVRAGLDKKHPKLCYGRSE